MGGALIAVALSTAPWLVWTLWLQKRASYRLPPLVAFSVSAAGGLGIASCVSYLLLETIGLTSRSLVVTDLVVALLSVSALWRLRLHRARLTSTSASTSSSNMRSRLWAGATALVICLAAIAIVLALVDTPYGVGDPVTNWTLKARFIYRGGAGWTDLFSPELPRWILSDYPLLLPLSIARVWHYVGDDTPAGPIVVQLVFWLALVTCVWGTVWRLRGVKAAAVATIAVVSMPILVTYTGRQYADVPFACLITASLSVLLLRDGDRAPLAVVAASGLLAGFAAWTKNEGLLFVLALVAVRGGYLLVLRRRPGEAAREIAVLVLGAAGPLLAVAHFKLNHGMAGASDDPRRLTEVFHMLADPARLAVVMRGAWRVLLSPALWGWGPLLAIGFFASAIRINRATARSFAFPAAVILVMALGYLTAYQLSPYDLAWHVRTSVDRLLLHLAPVAILTLAMASNAAPPERLRDRDDCQV